MEVTHRQGYEKKDLQLAARICSASIAKLAKNENVHTDIPLDCDISDIMEITSDK